MKKMLKADQDKLIKCLNMLTSSHDGEVLNAAKAVCKILASTKYTWDALLSSSGKSKTYTEAEYNYVVSLYKRAIIDEMRTAKEVDKLKAQVNKAWIKKVFCI